MTIIAMNPTNLELQLRIENLLTIGVISATDHPNGLCRVTIDEIQTDWLLVPQRVGNNYTQNNPVRIGTQVLLASVSGDLLQGVIIAMLPSEQLPTPSNEPHLDIIKFNDGTTLSYDSDSKQLDISAVNSINVTCKNAQISASENVQVDAAKITLNKGASVVTTAHICAFSGKPHSDGSSTVTAGK